MGLVNFNGAMSIVLACAQAHDFDSFMEELRIGRAKRAAERAAEKQPG